MHKVFIIRHGESMANIGKSSENPNNIPLSEKGQRQALNLIDILTELNVPEVYCSEFLRAQQTALPFITTSNKALHIVPTVGCQHVIGAFAGIQEFTFLCTTKYANTTPADRRSARNGFWQNWDLDFQDSNTSESFNTLLDRVEALERVIPFLKPNTAIVGHGLFFMTLLIKIQHPFLSDLGIMQLVHKYIYQENRNLDNAQIVPISISRGRLTVRVIP